MPTMVSDKRQAILEATMALIAERGFHGTAMSAIAHRSGVSAGIIYHYFDGKDDLIRSLYRDIKLALGTAMLRGLDQNAAFRDQFLHLWRNALDYHRTHPYARAFLDQYEYSPYAGTLDAVESLVIDELPPFRNLFAMVESGVASGSLKPLPLEILYATTFGVAANMARLEQAGRLVIDEQMIAIVAEACWDAIAGDR